jgi:hypothetical protein
VPKNPLSTHWQPSSPVRHSRHTLDNSLPCQTALHHPPDPIGNLAIHLIQTVIHHSSIGEILSISFPDFVTHPTLFRLRTPPTVRSRARSPRDRAGPIFALRQPQQISTAMAKRVCIVGEWLHYPAPFPWQLCLPPGIPLPLTGSRARCRSFRSRGCQVTAPRCAQGNL